MDIEVLGLPCGRGKHDACAGEFTLGIATFRRRHTCVCTCHFIAKAKAHDEYARRLTFTSKIELLPS